MLHRRVARSPGRGCVLGPRTKDTHTAFALKECDAHDKFIDFSARPGTCFQGCCCADSTSLRRFSAGADMVGVVGGVAFCSQRGGMCAVSLPSRCPSGLFRVSCSEGKHNFRDDYIITDLRSCLLSLPCPPPPAVARGQRRTLASGVRKRLKGTVQGCSCRC